jgi:hypothetical protein
MVKTPSQHWTIPPLENGDSEALLRSPLASPLGRSADRLNRYEFERRYNAMPNLRKAELIEGIFYMPAARRFKSHSQPHSWMSGWLVTYEATTPGVALGVECEELAHELILPLCPSTNSLSLSHQIIYQVIHLQKSLSNLLYRTQFSCRIWWLNSSVRRS